MNETLETSAPAPNPVDRAAPRVPPEILLWVAFLAGHRPTAKDRAIISTALASQGPLSVLTLIEARRALRELAQLDDVGRAHAWVAMRTSAHVVEQSTGYVRLALGVLHRRDPVVVRPDGFGYPVVTERSLRAWSDMRDLVIALAGFGDDRPDHERPTGGVEGLRSYLAEHGETPGAITTRRRVGHGPVARAAIEAMIDDADEELRAGIEASVASLDPTDVDAVDAHVERLWSGAELRRLVRVVGARPSRTVHAAGDELDEASVGGPSK